MICLTDNDYLLKFAACDLLDETLALFNLNYTDVQVLPTAVHKIRKDKKLRVTYGEGVDRALNFIELVGALPKEYASEEVNLMGEVLDENLQHPIDPGERTLLAFTETLNSFLVATGDKRCLNALTNAPTCASIHARHCGKIVCIEQTLLWLIEHFGFDFILPKIVPALACDGAIKAAFGLGYDARQASVIEVLESNVLELHNKTNGLLKLTL